MTRAEASWWHGRPDGAAAPRAQMIAAPLAERNGLHRWFPRLSGWIRLGAPLSLLDAASVVRLLPLSVAFTLPAMASGAQLAWPVAAVGLVITLLLLLVSFRPSFPFCQPVVLVGSFGVVLGAVALAAAPHRTGFVLLPAAIAALFIGLFMRLRPASASLLSGAVALLVTAQTTQDRAGFAGAVLVATGAALVWAMSSAMAHGARQAGVLDADTAIPNLRGVQRQLDRATQPIMVATVRLVGVSAAREALGHEAGTELVRCLVGQLTTACPPPMRIGRSADDELLVTLPVPGASDDAEHGVLHAVRTAMGSGRFLIGTVEVAAEAHIGVSMWRPERPDGTEPTGERSTDTPRDVLRRSALAARQAADEGAEVRWWDGVHTTLSADDLDLLADLRDAGQRGELWIAYQPQVGPDGSSVRSVEALLRWSHPTRGLVGPGRFVSLAERTGLIDRLTDWVVSEALDAQVRWRQAGLDVAVAVNVSPLSLRRVDFAARVSEAIVIRGLSPSVLTIEVTESSAFDVHQAVQRLSPLRSLGVRVSIDDFGTGFTSLAVLPDLAIDELKLDQRFVRGLLHDDANAAIVHSVLELAHRLRLVAVAEGAEDRATVDALRTLGFDLVQGYAFSEPLPEADLVRLLAPATSAVSSAEPLPLPPPPPLPAPPPVAVPVPSSVPTAVPVAAVAAVAPRSDRPLGVANATNPLMPPAA